MDALRCSRCGSPMKVLAVITDPSEVRRILLHLIKTGLAPPGPGGLRAELISLSPTASRGADPCLVSRPRDSLRKSLDLCQD